MSISESGDGLTSSEDEGAVGLPPSGVVATADPDPELMAMLARAGLSIGQEGQQTAQSRTVAAGWLVSRSGARLTTAFCSGAFFPQRCMRSWQSRVWPLLRPEATRPSPPSSLPSMAVLPGVTQAIPRRRERSLCTCAHETPPLGGTVRVSRSKSVSQSLL